MHFEKKKSRALEEIVTHFKLQSLFMWNDANPLQFSFLGCSLEKKMESKLGKVTNLQI
jgi:hypothetical protein